MKEIELTQGKKSIVDDEDFEILSKFKWYASFNSKTFYAMRSFDGTTALMHREILRPEPGQIVDHKNGNGLDNRKSNLRVCSHKQNLMNRSKQKNNSSGYKGVALMRDRNKWYASIKVNGKSISLGVYKEKEDAIKAYREASNKFFGEYDYFNSDQLQVA